MYYDDPERPDSARGIILADSSALLPMAVPVEDKFKTEKAIEKGELVSLLGMLVFLARNGYEIIIPEMVALECGGVARNGVSKDEIFNAKPLHPYYRRAQIFLTQVPYLSANIFIAPSPRQDNSPPAQFAQSTYRILKNKMTKPEKISILVGIERTYPLQSRKDFGDIAACQLVRCMNIPNVPVFYLSADMQARLNIQSIRQDISVSPVHVSGLYLAMQNENLLGEIGIRNNADFKGLQKNIHKFLLREGSKDGWKSSRTETNAIFQESLDGLRQELDLQTQTNNEHQPVRDDFASQRFFKRFGNLGMPAPGRPS